MLFKFYFFAVLWTCGGLGFCQNPEVSTTSGVVIGAKNAEAHSFYGVPYAQPPDGDYRFERPRPIVFSQEKLNGSVPTRRRCWESWLNCDADGICSENYSEDCLFLDINVPSTVDFSFEVEAALPVMLWIHGGAFSFGSGTELKYDGRYLANNTNTIVVAINYRLDALGCLVFEEEGVNFAGNQGIKDQQLAMKWVHDNIASFGGDNSKITIFGESAGGQSVTMHLMSTTSRPYFKQAIIQSYRAALVYQTKEQAKAKTQALLQALNCSSESKLECLRKASPISLMRAHDFVVENSSETFFDRTQPYRPILDGVEFTDPPLKYFQSTPKFDSDMRIIIGTTADEAASIKVEFENKVLTKEEFIAQNIYYAGPYYGPLAAEEYMKYAGNPDDPNFDFTNILAQEVADMMFVCPNRALARFLVDAIEFKPPDFPVFHYVFNDPVNAENCDDILGHEAPTQCNYASHAAELYYVFNSGPTTGLTLTTESQKLANYINELWGHFAYNGTPTFDIDVWQGYFEVVFWPHKAVVWPTFNMTASGSNQVEKYRSDACDYWDSLGFYVNFTSPTEPPEELTTSVASFITTHLLEMFFLVILVCMVMLY